MTQEFHTRVIAELTRVALARHDQPVDVQALGCLMARPNPIVSVGGELTVPVLTNEGRRVVVELIAALAEQI